MPEDEVPRKKTHKEWRKEVKKLRRKKIRQKLAEERNKKAAEEEAARLNDPEYQSWLREQEALEAAQQEQEELEREHQEELWLRRELLAEKEFREQKRKQEATLAVKDAERRRIQKEFQELQEKAQKRREERKQREEQANLEYERMMERITEYIKSGGSVPEELTSIVQSNPNKPPCPFFSKTNACRFRMQCCRNHIRPKLSRILFFPNFFTHIQLEQNDDECGSDMGLEYTDNQLKNDYFEFFKDVTSELKKYGEIENFRTCMNTKPHLRGNVLVEYKTEREALKAFMELQGRYYASRQINVEFSSIVAWKSAICGLSYTRKCPKGRYCNFLHIFRNPDNLYNISVFKQEESIRKTNRIATRDGSVMSWNDGDSSKPNWRWSESPEPSGVPSTSTDRKSRENNSTKRSEPSLNRSRSSEKRSKFDERYTRERSSNHRSRESSYRSQRERSSDSKLRHKQSRTDCSQSSRKSTESTRSSDRKRKRNDRHKKSKSRERNSSHSSSSFCRNGNAHKKNEKSKSRTETPESSPSSRHRRAHHKAQK